MSKLKLYDGLKKRIASGALAVLMMAGGATAAKADTAAANQVLDSREIVYNMDNSTEANLIVNSKDVLTEVVTNGELPQEYRTIVISPELTISGANQMRENILNANFESLFTNPEEFQYLSMGSLYMDNEDEKAILDEIAAMVQTVAVSPTEDGIQGILDYIRINAPLLSIGGKQALATDLFFLQALAQVYSIESDQLTAMAASYGENGDIITYIDAITGNQKCR